MNDKDNASQKLEETVASHQLDSVLYLRRQEQGFREDILSLIKAEHMVRSEDRAANDKTVKIQTQALRYNLISLIISTIVNSFIAAFTGGLLMYTISISNSANTTNELSKINSEVQLRAYVIDTNITNSDKLSPLLMARNAGQTPAYDLYYDAVGSFLPLDKRGGFTLPYLYPDFCKDKELEGKGTLASASDGSYVVHRADINGSKIDGDYNQKDLDEFLLGTNNYVIWGKFCYKDIFNRFHYKKFCRFYQNKDDLIQNTTGNCDIHNESDRIIATPGH